jgi:hypothetical protein
MRDAAAALLIGAVLVGGTWLFISQRHYEREIARWRSALGAADSAREAGARELRVQAEARLRSDEDSSLHLAVAVDSGRMYLERDGHILREIPVRVGVGRGVRTIASVSADTVALADGTRISGEGVADSAVDTVGRAAPVVTAPSADLEAILPDLQGGMKVYFYGNPEAPDTVTVPTKPYIVVSIADHRLWYREGDRTLYTTRVATGTGEELVRDSGGPVQWKFDTPRGRLVVLSKETDPEWVPPDWHYVELARKKKLGTLRLLRGKSIPLKGGAKILVDGNDVVTRYPDGHEEPFEVSEGKEIIADKKIVIPPLGTNQRRYTGTLGVFRLYFGGGYGLHGTDEPNSIGHSASHGCVRLRNEDIETLYRLVPLGTVVYIY